METPIVFAGPPPLASATALVPEGEPVAEADAEAELEAEEDESELEPHAASAASTAHAAKIRADSNNSVPPPRFMLRRARRALRPRAWQDVRPPAETARPALLVILLK